MVFFSACTSTATHGDLTRCTESDYRNETETSKEFFDMHFRLHNVPLLLDRSRFVWSWSFS